MGDREKPGAENEGEVGIDALAGRRHNGSITPKARSLCQRFFKLGRWRINLRVRCRFWVGLFD
jgi:hypothetical protein